MDTSSKGTIPVPAGYVPPRDSTIEELGPQDSATRLRSVGDARAHPFASGLAGAGATLTGASVAPLAALLGDALHVHAALRALAYIGGVDAAVAIVEWLAADRRQDGAAARSGVIALGTTVAQLSRDEEHQLVQRAMTFFGADPDREARLGELVLSALGDAGAPDLPRAAARVVAAMRMESLFPALVLAGARAALKHDVLACAVRVGDDLTAAVVAALHVGDAEVRAFACDCAGTLRVTALDALLKRLLRDPAPAVRIAALRAIETRGLGDAAKLAPGLLLDPVPEVRAAAVTACAFLDTEVVMSALGGGANANANEDSVCAVLAAFQEERADLSSAMAETFVVDPRPRVRAAALEALGFPLDARRLRLVASTAHDSDPDVRRAAVALLARSRGAVASGALSVLLGDPACDRILIIDAIAAHGDRRLTEALVRAFGASASDERRALVRAIGALEGPYAVGRLEEWFRVSEPDVRIAILQVLGALDTASAEIALAVGARDENARVRLGAAVLLSNKVDSELAFLTLRRLQGDPDPSVALIANAARVAESAALPTPLIPLAP